MAVIGVAVAVVGSVVAAEKMEESGLGHWHRRLRLKRMGTYC